MGSGLADKAACGPVSANKKKKLKGRSTNSKCRFTLFIIDIIRDKPLMTETLAIRYQCVIGISMIEKIIRCYFAVSLSGRGGLDFLDFCLFFRQTLSSLIIAQNLALCNSLQVA